MTMTAHQDPALTGSVPRRVTIVAPHTRVDLALPLMVTVAELIPQLVALTGMANEDAGPGGWQLGRLGAEPMEPGLSIAAAGVRDGEMLYLAPRSGHLLPALFDDVVDAIADDAEHRAGNWEPTDTVRTGLLVGITVALVGAAAALATDQARGIAVLVLTGVTLLCLLAGALLARAKGDGQVAVGGAVATVAVGAGALAGAVIVAGNAPVDAFGQPELLGGAAAAAFSAAVAAAAVPGYLRRFVTLAVVAFIGAGAAGAAAIWRPATVAAVLTAVALAVTALLPMAALRIAKLAPAPVPADMESFRAGEEPIRGRDVVDRADRAESTLDALVAGQSAVAVGGALTLAVTGGTPGRILAAVIGVALLLRTRLPRSRAQRYALLGSGLTAATLAVLSTGLYLDWQPAGAFAGVGAAAAAISFGYATRAPRRQPSPYVARALDVVEFIALASVIPLAAWVLDAYAFVRGLAG